MIRKLPIPGLAACLFTTLAIAGCGSDPYGVPCVYFCTDSTHIQRDYVDKRDLCRQLAELKTENMQGAANPDTDPSVSNAVVDKEDKKRLVAIFSECMNNTTWNVPGGEEKKPAAAPAAAATGPTPPPPAPESVLQAERKRAADCAFARQTAEWSIVAKKRAEACDLECKDQLELAPGAPKPAACP